MGTAKAAEGKAVRRGGIRLFQWITENPVWGTLILLAIVANAAMLGYDAHFGDTNPFHALIQQADNWFLGIFTVELTLEFLAQGPRRYFSNGWNWFDVIVVGICYIAVSPAISALRTLRVVRVFRLISAVPQMRRVVEALFGAMPGILATVAVLFVVFYIGAVMGTTLFRGSEGFNDLGQSALTLFQLSQFDGWGDIIHQLQADGHEYAWVFVLVFTIIAAFAVLNLFIGVIVEAVQEAPKSVVSQIKTDIDQMEEDVEDIQEAQEDAAKTRARILDELLALRAEVAALRAERGNPPS